VSDFKGYSICKFLAIILSILIAGQIHFAFSAQEETPEAKFKAAKAEFANGNYEAAKSILTGLTQAVEENEQNKVFLGYTYLLLGASEEMLKDDAAAAAHYQKAKELLGEREAAIEGLSFSSLNIYLSVFAAPKARDEAAALNAQFEEAKKKYFAEDYEGAKLALEQLVSTFAALEGWDVLKGETYLLLGATYEKLKYKELAVKYYCKAKEILGVDKTIAGLELKKLKYYKEECRPVAGQPGAKKGSFLGKALGIILGVGILAGAIWYLFFSPNAPLKKKAEKASGYTAITVKVDVTFKGLNSKTYHEVYLDTVNKLSEHVEYSQAVPDPSKCTDPNTDFCPQASVSQSYSYTVDTDGKSLDVLLKYIDWEYYSMGGSPICKILCVNWTFSIVSYKWESGKSDPGSPVVQGTDQLQMDTSTDCVATSTYIHTCTTNAHLTFKTPTAGQQGQKVYSVNQSTGRTVRN
jgi:tetratricopeptide (TPR) repeat protein